MVKTDWRLVGREINMDSGSSRIANEISYWGERIANAIDDLKNEVGNLNDNIEEHISHHEEFEEGADNIPDLPVEGALEWLRELILKHKLKEEGEEDG